MKRQRDERTKKTETSSSLKWSKSEMEVAEIILDFRCHVGLLSSIPFSWGCKRKRTASPSPATQNYFAFNAGADTVVKVEACSPVKGAAAVKVEAPETPPLSPAAVKSSKGKYAPKSCDINDVAGKAEIANFETPKLSKQKPLLKLQGESTLNTIHELTNIKNAINQEIGKVKQHFERMQNYNLWLNRSKQELRQSKAKNAMNKKQHQHLQQERFQSHHQNRNYGSSQMHKGKGVVHQTTSFCVGSSSIALGQNINNNNNGPIALLDLNLPMEESINVASFQRLAGSAQCIRRCDVKLSTLDLNVIFPLF